MQCSEHDILAQRLVPQPMGAAAAASDRMPLVSLLGVDKRFTTRAGADVVALRDITLAISRDQAIDETPNREPPTTRARRLSWCSC
jgi:hypothetical protein